MDIKKEALKATIKILEVTNRSLREIVQDEIKRNKSVVFCAEQIARFPDEEVDEEVMITCLSVIALSVPGSKSLTKQIVEGGTLDKIAI